VRLASKLALLGLGLPSATNAQQADLAVRNQWFTGSLEASSPALSKAGALAIEPYFIFQSNTGTYDNHGDHVAGTDNISEVQSFVVLKYGITNRLSVQALPSVGHVWNDLGSSDGIGFGDLPIELEYRFKNENGRTGSPSITGSFGIGLPTGGYDRLGSTLDGFGSGVFTAKQGIVVETLFDTRGGHPVRARLFGAIYEPLASASVRDVSVYGSAAGFHGNGQPGVSGQIGFAAGYAFTRRWVIALDIVQNVAAPYRLYGVDVSGEPANSRGKERLSTALAPAIEYNWAVNAGLIFGVEASVAGRNSASYVAPQIAVALSF
jgi:hypothetical protein